MLVRKNLLTMIKIYILPILVFNLLIGCTTDNIKAPDGNNFYVIHEYIENSSIPYSDIAYNSAGVFISSNGSDPSSFLYIKDSIPESLILDSDFTIYDMETGLFDKVWVCGVKDFNSFIYSINETLDIIKYDAGKALDIEINSVGEVFYFNGYGTVGQSKSIYQILDTQTSYKFEYNNLIDDDIIELAIDDNDNFWIVTMSNSIYCLNKDTVLNYYPYESYVDNPDMFNYNTATNLIVENNKIWLMLNRRDFYYFDGDNWTEKILIDDFGDERRSHLQKLSKIEANLYFPLKNTIFQIDKINNNWDPFIEEPNNPYIHFKLIQKIDEGKFWIVKMDDFGKNYIQMIRII